MAGSEMFIWDDASLCPAGCLAAQAVPLLVPLSDPGSRWCGLQFCSGVQEAVPGLQPFLGGRVLMKWVPVVIGLLCALGFCGDCSADVRGSDAREGIKAGDGGCFDAPSHYPTGLIEDRV